MPALMPMDVLKAKALDNCFSEMFQFPELVIKGFSYKDFRDGLSVEVEGVLKDTGIPWKNDLRKRNLDTFHRIYFL